MDFIPYGDHVAFLRGHDYTVFEIGVLNVACGPPCPVEFIKTFSNVKNHQGISWPQEERIYYSASASEPDSYPMYVYAIDTSVSTWSSPRVILSGTDSIFAGGGRQEVDPECASTG